MGRAIINGIVIIILVFLSGEYPVVAVGLTAITITSLFLVFGNKY